jgi:multicomponent Na+:H+ antiporter subunit A
MAFVLGFAGFQTRLLQSGYLRFYLLIILLVVFFLTGSALLMRGGLSFYTGSVPPVYECIVAGVVLAAALVSVASRGRLSAIAALGVVGYGIALLYMLYGAPDLAITQFAVETLTVIIFVLVYFRLPPLKSFSLTRHRVRDAAIAVVAGGVMGALVLGVASFPSPTRLKEFFGETSLSLAGGRNIVNVILVDFRALDTMGETIVLAASALGIYGLLRLWVKA